MGYLMFDVEEVENFRDKVEELEVENKDLKLRLNRATEQWNIWCAAYQELANK